MINTYAEWLDNVTALDDVTCRAPAYYDNYREKRAIALDLVPSAQLIAEIGVRTGYAAHAFLSGEPAKLYVGYDRFTAYGEWRGGWDNVDKILHRDFPNTHVTLVQVDTQKMAFIGLRNVDLFHIDGDHEHDGCLHDMQIAWPTIRKGGVLLVDDYDLIPGVRSAVQRFIYYTGKAIEKYSYVHTFRGDMAIVKD